MIVRCALVLDGPYPPLPVRPVALLPLPAPALPGSKSRGDVNVDGWGPLAPFEAPRLGCVLPLSTGLQKAEAPGVLPLLLGGDGS
eukprot:COSAG05_NODE_481_length_9383_cov_6.957777_2_plen_85_part_00